MNVCLRNYFNKLISVENSFFLYIFKIFFYYVVIKKIKLRTELQTKIKFHCTIHHVLDTDLMFYMKNMQSN